MPDSICAAVSDASIYFLSTQKITITTSTDIEKRNISSLSWRNDNNFIVFGSGRNTLWVANAKVPSNKKCFDKKNSQHIVKYFKKNQDKLVSGGTKGVSLLWKTDGNDMDIVKKFNHSKHTLANCISTNSSDLLFGIGGYNTSDQSELYIFDISNSKEPILNLQLQNQLINNLVFSPIEENMLFYTTSNSKFCSLDVNNLTSLRESTNIKRSCLTGIYFFPSNPTNVIVPQCDGDIAIYDTSSLKLVNNLKLNHEIISFELLENEQQYLVGTESGKIYHYDLRNPNKAINCITIGKWPISQLVMQYKNTHQLVETGENFSDFDKYCKDQSLTYKKNRRGSLLHSKPIAGVLPALKSKFRRCLSVSNIPKSNIFKGFKIDIDIKDKLNSSTSEHTIEETLEFKENYPFTTTTTTTSSRNSVFSIADCFDTSKNIKENQEILNRCRFDIHEEIKAMHFSFIKMLHNQCVELKTYIDETFKENYIKEKQLMEENIRLHREIAYQKKLREDEDSNIF